MLEEKLNLDSIPHYKQAELERRAQSLYALCSKNEETPESLWQKTAFILKK